MSLILDGHVHLGRWTDAWYPGLHVDWKTLDEEFTAAGVQGAVVTSSDMRDHRQLLHPPAGLRGRYWLFPWVDPNTPEDLRWLEKGGEGVSGLKIHPSGNKVAVNDDRLDPYFELAAERGWSVVVHCGRWQEMSSYKHALHAAEKHPRVAFFLAHMGGDTPALATAAQDALAASGQENVWFGLEGMREFFYVARGIERLGVERFLFGSDYPVGHPRMYLGLAEALHLAPKEKELFLGGNLLRVLEGRWRKD